MHLEPPRFRRLASGNLRPTPRGFRVRALLVGVRDPREVRLPGVPFPVETSAVPGNGVRAVILSHFVSIEVRESATADAARGEFVQLLTFRCTSSCVVRIPL